MLCYTNYLSTISSWKSLLRGEETRSCRFSLIFMTGVINKKENTKLYHSLTHYSMENVGICKSKNSN